MPQPLLVLRSPDLELLSGIVMEGDVDRTCAAALAVAAHADALADHMRGRHAETLSLVDFIRLHPECLALLPRVMRLAAGATVVEAIQQPTACSGGHANRGDDDAT